MISCSDCGNNILRSGKCKYCNSSPAKSPAKNEQPQKLETADEIEIKFIKLVNNFEFQSMEILKTLDVNIAAKENELKMLMEEVATLNIDIASLCDIKTRIQSQH
jgi:hypothetical protein